MQRISGSRCILASLAVSFCLLFASRVSAATALIMGGTSSPVPSVDYLDGFRFYIDSPIAVTALGFFDFEGNGLLSPHDVGLWDANGMLLGMVAVPAGTAGYLEDDFRWVALPTPIVIPAGTYTVAGTDGDDPVARDYTSIMGPEITYVEGAWVESGTLTYPTESQPVAGLGGNFQYDVIPEPSTWALVVLGACGVWVVRRRRRGAER